jgi:hypothetical protein
VDRLNKPPLLLGLLLASVLLESSEGGLPQPTTTAITAISSTRAANRRRIGILLILSRLYQN